MSSEDETRVMAIPAEVRSLMMGPTPNPEAETPCIGVPSVGDTHVGETQLALERLQPSGRSPSKSTVVPSRGRSGSSAASSFGGWISRVPRSVALGIGASVGVGAALLIGLLTDREVVARSAPVISARVEALVQTEEGTGVPDVAVRVGNQVVLTDDAGRAPFPPVLLDGPLTVNAECPAGYAGGDLFREIPKAVAASSKAWSFRLVCRPEFSEVSLLVETRGCGEMRVWVDGALSGTTTEGSLTVKRLTQTAEVVEVRAEPTSGQCEFDKVRHVTLSTREAVSRARFDGTMVRPLVRKRTKTPETPLRPYRL